MLPERVICFVDGFNLYHALKDLKQPHLKWLDLQTLFRRLTPSRSQIIVQILFFSGYPTWKPNSYQRHRQYIAALSASGVTPILGHFKPKEQVCLECGSEWIRHEEKESDVNLALALLDLAYKDRYDHAYVLSRDSDLSPAIRKVKENFPSKNITVFAPFNYRHSSELIQVSGKHKTIKYKHLATSLFPEKIFDAGGNLITIRPKEYTPTIQDKLKNLQDSKNLKIKNTSSY